MTAAATAGERRAPDPLLELRNVHKRFGGVTAVNGVSFGVRPGGIAGLIGPNGAGKTTVINLVTGQLAPDSGEIIFDGDTIGGRRPHQVAARGVARTFQNIRLYRTLTARENIVTGMHVHRGADGPGQLIPRRQPRPPDAARQEEAARLLTLVGLDPAAIGGRLAGTLSYGDQRRLEIARALALQPRLLLLDEPAAGMNPSEKSQMRDLLKQLSGGGLTVVLIDHDIKLVLGVCDDVTVLNFGHRIASGRPAEVAADEAVITAYLGSGRTPETSGPAAPERRRRQSPSQLRPLLEVEHLSVSYGVIEAVADVSLVVAQGEIAALIGANGAGKTTVLRTLSGLLRPKRGRARFGDLDLASARPQAIVGAGLIHVPEGREILTRLTVEENLLLGGWTRRDRAEVGRSVEEMMEKFPILRQRRSLPAGQLSGGEQQLLAIARALIGRPRLLLLDEPSLGLAPQLAEQVFSLVESIRGDGITILLVEQNARRALELADRAYVIETGRVVLAGTGEELQNNPQVQRAYLGTS